MGCLRSLGDAEETKCATAWWAADGACREGRGARGRVDGGGVWGRADVAEYCTQYSQREIASCW